jgi:O-antigen/teichoic acid export membrane protein
MVSPWGNRKGPGTTGEGSQARIVRNTLANIGGTVVMVVVGLALSPFMIHRLGVEPYGIWILATTLSYGFGYLSFADLGFEQSTVRYIAEARAARDAREMNRILATTFAVLTGIVLILVPLLLLLANPFVDLFSVPEYLRPEAVVAVYFVVGQLLFEIPSRAFAALLEGAQRYGLWQLARVVQVLVSSGLVVAALLAGKGIDWVGGATFSAQAVTFALLAILAMHAVPGARLSPRNVSRRVARKLASFGGRLVVLRLLTSIYRPMDKVIIGIALTGTAVTTYEVANKLYMGAWLIQSLVTSALIPATAFNRDDPARLREMLLRGSSYALAIALPFVIAAFVFAEPLLRTWFGVEQTNAVTPARFLLLELALGFAFVVGRTMLVGLGAVRRLIWVAAGWTTTNIGLSIALVGPLGINGVVGATLISTAFVFFPITWLSLREMGVSPLEWIRDVIVPVLPALAAQIGVSLLLLPLAEATNSLLVVGALCALTVAVAIVAWVVLGLSQRRRRDLMQVVRDTAGIGAPIPEVDLAGDSLGPAGVSTPPANESIS